MRYPITVPKEQIKIAVELLIDGLLTDGDLHKQWYMEETLKALGMDLEYMVRELGYGDDEYVWEPGIEP